MSGAAAPRSAMTGVIWSASAPRRTIVGRSWSRNSGNSWRSRSRSTRRSAVASATLLMFSIEAATCRRCRASGAMIVSESTASRLSCRFCLASSRTLVDVLERRVGAPDHRLQVRAAAGEADAELVEDDREPCALGLAHDVVEQVEVDRRARVLHRQQVLALARALVDLAQRRRRLLAGRARCVGSHSTKLLADQRLRPDHAVRVGAEVLVARVVDLEHDRGFELRRDRDVVDRADLDAGDLDVLAGDDEAGVVEDRAYAVGLRVVARDQDERQQRGDDEHDDDGDRASHGPGSTWLGSQSRLPARRATAPSRPAAAGRPRPGSARADPSSAR